MAAARLKNITLPPTMAATLVNVSTREPPPLQALSGTLDPNLVAIIAKCLHKNPADRWASCDELAAALAPFEDRNNGIYTVGPAASSPSGPGRTVSLDGTGQARPYESPADPGDLVLHLPDEARAPALLVGLPTELSAAQRAAYDWLVRGSSSLPQRESS